MKRIFSLMALGAIVLTGTLSGSAALAQESRPVISAKGNAYLNDFLVLANKRPDLKMSLTRKGLDAAFTDWLRAERPAAYRVAAASAKTDVRVASRKTHACGEATCRGEAACSGQKSKRAKTGSESSCCGAKAQNKK